jgi:hypothetical protein
MNRTGICETLTQLRDQHPVADLAFYASRDLSKTHWRPFVTAALERNPVIIEATKMLTMDHLIQTLQALPNESIYDATRVAQPDEVWNYQRGDGLECAIALATCLRARDPALPLKLTITPDLATLLAGDTPYHFASTKRLQHEIDL